MAYVNDSLIDTLLRNGTDTGGSARSSEFLPGDLPSRASAAIDGDPTSAWQTAFEDPTGEWIEVSTATAVDELTVHIVADGRHSVPAELLVSVDGGDPVLVDVSRVG